MEMTSTQRLILANQYELMALLTEQAAQFRRLKTIVQSGFAKELAELDKDFSYLSEAECDMVRNTWRCITHYRFAITICRINLLSALTKLNLLVIVRLERKILPICEIFAGK